MIVRIDAKAWGGGGSNLSVGLTLSVLISNFDSPLTHAVENLPKRMFIQTEKFWLDIVDLQTTRKNNFSYVDIMKWIC